MGSNIIAGVKPDSIVDCVNTMLESSMEWKNPFGNGDSAEKIVDILEEKL